MSPTEYEKIISIGWVYVSLLESENHNYSRILRQVLERLSPPLSLSHKDRDFLTQSLHILRGYGDFRVIFFRGFLYSILNSDKKLFLDPLTESLFETVSEEREENCPPLEVLSDMALEKGYCSQPQTNPGSWAIRKILSEL